MILFAVRFFPENLECCTETSQCAVRFEIVQLQIAQPGVAHRKKALASWVVGFPLPEVLCQGKRLRIVVVGLLCVSKKELERAEPLIDLNDCLCVLLVWRSGMRFGRRVQSFLVAADGRC